MIVGFGKHKGKDIKDIPDSYLRWVQRNIDKKKMVEPFVKELERRKTKTYNPLIFGKDKTENIVNITWQDNICNIYMLSDGQLKRRQLPWLPNVLSRQRREDSKRLKGDGHYKYITGVSLNEYEEIIKRRPRGTWVPRSIEEGFMLENGYTYFKGMKFEDLSILSFDLEATTIDPDAELAYVPLLSFTFRNRNGKITKRMFDVYEYDNREEMWIDINMWVKEIDPDIIIGHNILGYDLPYADKNSTAGLFWGRDGSQITFDKKVSKFRKDGSQQYEFFNAHINGRDIIDTLFLSIRYDIGRNFDSYGLKAIEEELRLVSKDRIKWDFKKWPVKKLCELKSKGQGKEIWEKFKQYCSDDSDSPIKIFDIMAPPFFYLTQSVPKTFQQIINEASGSQLDSLMIRSYLQDGYSQPKTTQIEEFEGAVSMGVPGVYDNVIKFDVASLYPSIMLEYQIYDRFKDPKKHLLQMLAYFRNQRLENKRLAKKTKERYYDDMQAAQKRQINSMYGFLGTNYLLYNMPKGAEKVTRKGREINLKGIKWGTGWTLKKEIKKIKNKGKENEEKIYHWVLDEKVSEGKGYDLVNTDTDSFSMTNGIKPSDEDFKKLLDDLNSQFSDMIVWENDGIFDKVIVVKTKNYVLKNQDKIKFKGSSITDQKKEPALTELLEKCLVAMLDGNKEECYSLFKTYCQEAHDIQDINRWVVKKTITDKMLNPKRANEQNPLDAILEAMDKGVIQGYQEGDKIWVYQYIRGQKQKITKGEPVFLKDGTPTTVDDTALRFPELWDGNYDRWHYVKRTYMTLNILENLLDMDQVIKYHNKNNRKLLSG